MAKKKRKAKKRTVRKKKGAKKRRTVKRKKKGAKKKRAVKRRKKGAKKKAAKRKKKGAKKKAAKRKKKKGAKKKKAAKKKKKAPKKKAKKKKKAPKKKAKKKKKRKASAAFMRPLTASPALQAVIGSKPLPRSGVVKKLWAYIRKHGLQDATNRRMINADDNLRAVFRGKAQVSMFEMNKLVSRHLT